MAAVDRDALVLAIQCLWFVIRRAKMLDERRVYERHLHPWWERCGWAEVTPLKVSANLVAGLKAAKDWLDVVSNYGSTIGAERYGVAECLSYVEMKLDVIAQLKISGISEIEFYGEEIPVFLAAGRYLDRALMLQENDSGERRNKARPNGGKKRNR